MVAWSFPETAAVDDPRRQLPLGNDSSKEMSIPQKVEAEMEPSFESIRPAIMAKQAFSKILSFGSEDQRLAYLHLLDPYTLFAALGESDSSLADAVLDYGAVVLDSVIEDRSRGSSGWK
jgi:hypothetical protein